MAHGPTFLKSKVRNGSPVRFTPHMEHEGKYKVIPIIDMRKVAEAGKFKIMIGTDSQNGLETFFEVK
ncbi:hypothetical protein [Bacteroides acidifaciens]|jgi:hypothetical protein|uniref:Uncharacterized protein n=1 Tax=Bacteroides acidifaciens TaxID=85831 RepID=A0A7J0A323_9BACE|nr:hypothetical protein [Bacteroides acidifaciens]MCR2004184.1 hypothetical protein [Bacteroides acidifaciens]GFH86778.1 hypothetical protein IMSAGC001_02189 [Bacteroides acidifaciens]